MKNTLKRSILPAIVASLIFVIPATAVEPTLTTTTAAITNVDVKEAPSSMSFQIPMHDYCSADNPFDFGFQLSNASGTTANVTLYLYQKDGSVLKDEGVTSAGLESTILPGKPFNLGGNATELYHMNFGNHKKCDERIYSGKIVVNNGQASLLAKGWVYRRVGGSDSKLSELITINESKSFDLAK